MDLTLRRVLGVSGLVGLTLAGCFGGSGIAAGPCTLKVSADEQGVWRELEQPPYTVHLGTPATQVNNGPSALIFSGTGWQGMAVLLRHISGEQSSGRLTRQDVTGETTGVPLTRVGQWEVRLSDPLTGCRREFTLEAVSP